MKGLIKNGKLYIERRGKMIEQFCPFTYNGDICGDWCPLFGEPETDMVDSAGAVMGIYLQLCNSKVLYFNELEIQEEK